MIVYTKIDVKGYSKGMYTVRGYRNYLFTHSFCIFTVLDQFFLHKYLF